MSEYPCKRCGFVANRKQILQKHLSRKHVCQPVLEDIPVTTLLEELVSVYVQRSADGEYSCEYCHRKFNTRSNTYTHKKVCKQRPKVVNVQELEERMTQMQEEMLRLQEQVTRTTPATTSVTNNTNNNCNNNNNIVNNTINIIPFGREDLSFLAENKDLLDRCLRRREKGVVEFLKEAYFSKEHPEHNNVRVTNYKMNLIDTFNGSRWQKCDKDEVLDDLVTTSCNHLDEHYEETKDEISSKYTTSIMKLIEDFVEKVKDIDIHKKFYADLKRKVHIMLVNESRDI